MCEENEIIFQCNNNQNNKVNFNINLVNNSLNVSKVFNKNILYKKKYVIPDTIYIKDIY